MFSLIRNTELVKDYLIEKKKEIRKLIFSFQLFILNLSPFLFPVYIFIPVSFPPFFFELQLT